MDLDPFVPVSGQYENVLFTSTRASCHVYCIKHEDFSCYMCLYHDDPLPTV